MPASDVLQKGLGTAYNVLSKQFQHGAVVALLKASDTSNEFETLLEIESKRFFEYSAFRKNVLLEIADDYDELTTAVQEATHVSIDDDIYIIAQGDTLAPSGTNPVWQLFLDLFEKKGHYTEI